MTDLILVGALVGGILGLRLRVWVLVPATCFALIIVVVVGIAHGDHIARLLIAMIAMATALQLGYLGGNAVQLVRGPMRTARHRRVSLPT